METDAPWRGWQHLGSRIMAAALPAFILGLAYARLTGAQTEDARRQLENAGQLLNGEVLEEPVTRAIRKKMKSEPRVVVLGNSFANTNIHLTALSSTLGLKLPDIARLSIPNTIGAHWYALLKYQVFVGPHEAPDLVVITTDLQSALLNVPLSEGSQGNLASLAKPGDPLIDAKVGHTDFWWTTVKQNRDLVRRNTVLAVRDRAASVVLGRLPEAKLRSRTNQAMDRVFHASLVDPALTRGVLPVTVGNEVASISVAGLQPPDNSFLPAIAELCYQHGARLILVRNHQSPAMPANKGDLVPEGTKRAVRAAIEPWGGVLVDLHQLPMVRDTFENLDHMTDEGAKRFSRALGTGLTHLGVLDDKERLVRASEPLRPTRLQEGRAAEMAQHRQTWIPVEGEAVWAFPEPWPDRPGTFRVRAVLESLGEKPTLEVAGTEVLVTAIGERRWTAELEGPPPEGPWTLVVRGPDPTVVQSLVVGTGSAPLMLAGDRQDAIGPSYDLLGSPEIHDGDLVLEPVQPTAESEPPALPPRRMGRAPNRVGTMDARGLRFLSDFESRKLTPLFARCSPTTVLEQGVPLPKRNVGCTEVRDLGEGRMCHTDKKVLFSASDGVDPVRSARKYELALDLGRSCDGSVWVYPGDKVHLAAPRERIADFRSGISRVQLTAHLVSPKASSLAVEVRVNGTPRTLGVLNKPQTSLTLQLDPPAGPLDEVELVFAAGADTFALVTRAALEAEPIPWGQAR